ncbi:MAG: FAD-binding protein [Cyclobacteriaceae bacterium]
MTLKDKLPVSYLLFTSRGRINRLTYWIASLFIWTSFYVLFVLTDSFISDRWTWIWSLPLFLALYATAAKRLHDQNLSSRWLLCILIPVAGPLFLLTILGFRPGSRQTNRFGMVPFTAPDYLTNPEAQAIPHLKTAERIVNDVTGLNPIVVSRVEAPATQEELIRLVRESTEPLCIGGGRFSMGGQTASPGCLHIDMRKLNRIVSFSPSEAVICVEAGIRWCDIQQHIDPHGLSVKIMQTYANFTVGGSLSVNCHGRYIGLGPLILSVRSLDVLTASGDMMHVSPHEQAEIFYACVGGYNAVAIIVQAEFELTANKPVIRSHRKMPRSAYGAFFRQHVRENPQVVFHNADIYPPHYKTVRAVSWTETTRKPTVKTRLMPLAASYPLERYFIGAFARGNFGKWRREHLIDPLVFWFTKIHWRNYEAGYDVRELEPASRVDTTFVLQEYFVGIDKLDEFTKQMAEIFIRHQVNVINISIRHARKDSGSLMAWAREEVFAFVVYYCQRTDVVEKSKVAVWTRELIDAVLSSGGTYYIPYQAHATPAQFMKAYPGAEKLFELKKRMDPGYRFRNVLWDTYYQPTQL